MSSPHIQADLAATSARAKQLLNQIKIQSGSYDGALTRRLPFLSLDIHSFTSDFKSLCDRALVDMQVFGDEPSTRLHVLISDQECRPDLMMPELDYPSIGLGALISYLESEGIDGCFDSDHLSWQLMSNSLGVGLQQLKKANNFPPWERAFPLRNFLHWSYAAQNRRLMHAGSLGYEGRGVLLAGDGGAGKSGTTLAGVLYGLQSVGDDYLLIDIDASGVSAFPVMALMKQDAKGLTRLGLDIKDPLFGSENWQSKFEFDFNHLVSGSRAQQLSISAVLLPRITGDTKSRLRPASSRDVMFALMPNNLQQLPGRMKQGFDFVGRLSRELPGYHLELGDDPQEIAETIRNFLLGKLP